jgi:hypothetical protein
MNRMISYCGLTCTTCPIYLAGRETDLSKKEKMILNIIEMCKTHYGIEYEFEDINECDGCKSVTGNLFAGCKDCPIKKCAVERGIENCAYCDGYPCVQLQDIIKSDPGARTRLEAIRDGF